MRQTSEDAFKFYIEYPTISVTSNDHYVCLFGRDENLIPDNENHSNCIYEFQSFSDKPAPRPDRKKL